MLRRLFRERRHVGPGHAHLDQLETLPIQTRLIRIRRLILRVFEAPPRKNGAKCVRILFIVEFEQGRNANANATFLGFTPCDVMNLITVRSCVVFRRAKMKSYICIYVTRNAQKGSHSSCRCKCKIDQVAFAFASTSFLPQTPYWCGLHRTP